MFLLILGFPPDFAPFLPEFAHFLPDFNDWLHVAGLRCLPRRAPPRGRGAGGKLERQQKTGQLITPWCRCLNIFYSACKYFCQAWDERLLRRAASGRAATGGGPAAAATAAAPSTWTMWSSR